MNRIAIVGAGLIGRAWAMVFARAGHAVNIHDADDDAVPRAIESIGRALADLGRYGLIAEPAELIAARVSPAKSLEAALQGCVYCQENTAEDLDTKRAIFSRMDAAADERCILASSTSTIPASAFSRDLKGRQRCIVVHPVNPPHLVPLVELSPAPWTAPEVVARTRELHESIGQVPITINREIEGFILNRLQAVLLNEAWRLVKEGLVSVEDLDKCVRDGLGLRWAFMGPFETIDLNAPGGVRDYAARYGPKFHAMTKDVQYEPWDPALIALVEAQRRAILPASEHLVREAWRDRRLMALVAHKRSLLACGDG